MLVGAGMRSGVVVGCVSTLALLAASLTHCSSGSSPAGPGTDAGGADSPTTDDGGGFEGGFGGDGSSPPTNGCAPDLQTILDPSGKPIGKCPPDQGCLGGQCVAPCDAAAGAKSTIGCEYYAHEYAISVTNSDMWWTYGDIRGGCYAAVVVNTWPTPTHLTVTRAGTNFPLDPFARLIGTDGSGNITYGALPSTGLPTNAAAVLFLSYDNRGAGKGDDIPCPPGVTAATTVDSAIHVTGYNDAFHVTTDRPITAYQVYPWGGAASFFPSATVLYPKSAWDTNYVAPGINDAFAVQVGGINGLTWEKPFVTMVAADDTQVTLLPKIAIDGDPSNGIPSAAPNTAVTYSIKAGQYLQLLQQHNLGGTVIQSTKPIGVFVGTQMFTTMGGDGDNQGLMIPAVRAEGFEYVGASYALPAPTPWQLVGAVDGTTLTYDPAPPAGAPSTIGRGDVVEFSAQSEFTVRSQDASHPFELVVYRRGQDPPDPGGPDFVGILPPVQFRSQYVFVTDPTYKTTTLVFVRPKATGDVTLDCAGTLGGWQNIGSGAYQVARVTFGAGSAASCKNGAHQATSTSGTFGITVWGWDLAASYGYPAGGNSAPVNDVVVKPTPK